ncbi:villin-like 1 [Striga asiatica]|uniref:Villin-like 1 n=1 Tax=Striga asiatica TaxID=4170 RepID=A0A5A7RGW5_STRAF|nr:villin-like 1 [Striga asiatica]
MRELKKRRRGSRRSRGSLKRSRLEWTKTSSSNGVEEGVSNCLKELMPAIVEQTLSQVVPVAINRAFDEVFKRLDDYVISRVGDKTRGAESQSTPNFGHGSSQAAFSTRGESSGPLKWSSQAVPNFGNEVVDNEAEREEEEEEKEEEQGKEEENKDEEEEEEKENAVIYMHIMQLKDVQQFMRIMHFKHALSN